MRQLRWPQWYVKHRISQERDVPHSTGAPVTMWYEDSGRQITAYGSYGEYWR